MGRVLLGLLLVGLLQLVPPENVRLLQGIPSSSATIVTITAPTSSATYDAGSSSTLTTLAGTAKANQTISACTWTNSLGGSGSATGTATWTIASVALTVGSNVITVTCPNAIGTGTDVITVTRSGGTTNPVDAARRVDWSLAGPNGGIPTGRTQCGSTVAAGSTSAQINTAIQACTSGQYVQLASGAYTVTATMILKNGVTVRGAGANATLMTVGGTFTQNGECDGILNSVFCLGLSNVAPTQLGSTNALWTAGYTKGTTTITLAGSVGIVAGTTVLNLTQLDEATDTGNIWNCVGPSGAVGGGLGGPCGPSHANGGGGTITNEVNCATGQKVCSQMEQVLVVSCSPACGTSTGSPHDITISPGLVWPNWSGSKSPGAWWTGTQATGMGVEDLSVDMQSGAVSKFATMINCNGCYLMGVRSLMAGRDHVMFYECFRCAVVDSYFWENENHADQSYGIELTVGSSWALVENNIFQRVTDSTPNNNGGGCCSVGSYNYASFSNYTVATWFQSGDYDHASGYGFWLREGNDTFGLIADGEHGTHHFTTAFRNRYNAWQTGKTQQTIPIHLYGASRYFSIVGNVLGESSYHTGYECVGVNASDCSTDANVKIYTLGYAGNGGNAVTAGDFCQDEACSLTRQDSDKLTSLTLMRWGNWDTVTSTNDTSTNDTTGIRWVSAEVPSGTTYYPNPVPGTETLPSSFYLSSQPSWWAGAPWPPIGPDVTSGDLANTGGHANRNPARRCYENVMGGTAGTTGALTFNRASCYGSR